MSVKKLTSTVRIVINRFDITANNIFTFLVKFTSGTVQISYDASGGVAQTVRVPSYGGEGFGQIVI